MKRFLFFYFMGDEYDTIQQTIPDHAKYWQGLALPGYDGGPFMDRSGGCVVFQAETLTDAREIVVQDPFVIKGCLSEYYVNEWVTENPSS